MTEAGSNKLIAKNAVALYLRMFVTMAISFYTSRVLLMALGVSDYGIRTVVGGVIVMISVLTGTLGNSTARFLTFALGRGNMDEMKLTFSTAFFIHLSLAILFFLVSETVGLWFVNTQLVIPEGRMVAANFVYQASVVGTVMGMTQNPYSTSITAHEKMGAFAYIQILNSVLKLGITFIVLYSAMDHLILYSILILLLSIAFQIYYRLYCIKRFEECKLVWKFDKSLFKQMMWFSGWGMIGSLTLMGLQQGTTILINRFFGTLINAAVGVASQVQGLLYAFTGNVNVAFRPQIIKSYATGDYGRFNFLIAMGSKFSSFITILTTVPFYFNISFLMDIWLDEVPKGAVEIFQILIISNFFNSFNTYLNVGIDASGKIKSKNIALSILYILFLILTYIILKLTHSYIISYIFGIFTAPISTIIMSVILKTTIKEYKIQEFFLQTFIPMTVVAFGSVVLAWFINSLLLYDWLKFILTAIVCTVFELFSVLYFVLDNNSRLIFIKFVKSKIGNRK